jgi:hypothetical protein
VHRNKQKEKLTTAQCYTKVVNGEFLDMTDMENPGTPLFLTFLTFRIPIYSLIVNSGLGTRTVAKCKYHQLPQVACPSSIFCILISNATKSRPKVFQTNASCFANLYNSHPCHPIHNQATHPKTFRSVSSSSLRIIVLPNAILRNHLKPFIQNHSNIVPTRQLSSERGRRTFDHVSLDLEGRTNL